MRKLALIASMCFVLPTALTQNADVLLNHDLYHYADRMDIMGLTGEFFPTHIKPYGRNVLADFFAKVDTQGLAPVERNWHRRMRMLVDDAYAAQQRSKGIANTFYTNGRDLYRVEENPEEFRLYVNPAFHLSLGK